MAFYLSYLGYFSFLSVALLAFPLIYLIIVTLGITGLIQIRVLIIFDVWHLDVGSNLNGLQHASL